MNKQDVNELNPSISPRHNKPARGGLYRGYGWLDYWLHYLVKKQIYYWSIRRLKMVANYCLIFGGSLFTNASLRRYNYIISGTNPSRSCGYQPSKESR